MARLDHPGIVPIYDVGFLPNGELFFAMERIRGNTLRWYLDQRKTKSDIQKSLSELVPVFEQVCHIVAYAHSKQIVHRDLKPENIMIGPYRTVYVMDWGIARDLSKEGSSGTAKIKYLEHLQEALKSRRIKGTPRYMSPEQAIGIDDVDYRSDVFALGIIFYEILTGTHPFCDDEDDARQTLNKIKNQKPRPFPKTLWINGAWESICMKALQKLPNDRYPDAKPFADDIHRSLHYENVSVHQENLFSWGFRLIQRHRLLTLATLMSLLLLSIVSYHFLSGVH
ncbi:MAG: serine/threonine-protein kinase, partial [Candidatus Bathyarchaeia archaeon]